MTRGADGTPGSGKHSCPKRSATAEFVRRFWRFAAICLVFALPTIAAVGLRVAALRDGIAQVAREEVGLSAGLVAAELLLGVERYRVALLDDGPEAASRQKAAAAAVDVGLSMLRRLPLRDVSDAGPRTGLAELDGRWNELQHIAGPSDRGLGTIPFAETVLALLLDLEDSSGLTYDPNVTSINLSDALVARLPSGAERRDRSAELVELARRRGRMSAFDVSAAEVSAGEARDALAAAVDDLNDAAGATPALEPQLQGARRELESAGEDLTLTVNAVALDPRSARARTLSALRLRALAASSRAYRVTAAVLAAGFEARIAAARAALIATLIAGASAVAVTWAATAALWRALRRRSKRELDRANERAQALEASLARKNAERALRLTEQQFRAVFDGTHVGIAIVDREVQRIDANAAFRAMFAGGFDVIAGVARRMFAQLEAGSGSALSGEQRFEIGERPALWAEVSLSLIQAEPDEAPSAIVMVHDITEHKTLHAQLDHQTLHDPLTALPNHRFFMRRLEARIAAGAGEPFAVVFIDLDRFKSVNDALGHHAGDALLRLAAQRLTDAVRDGDFVARLHGDEFAVLLADLPPDAEAEMAAVAARLAAALQFPIDTGGPPIVISGSIGVVCSNPRYTDAESYLRDADSAMYRSKVGGGGVTFFDGRAARREIPT